MIAAILLATVVVITPHGDDEVTLLPLIQETNATVVVVTDGAATSKCNGGYDCETRRRESTEAFLAETSPGSVLMWLVQPDGALERGWVEFLAVNLCPAGVCDLWASGYDYGHPDHNAAREGVAAVGGRSYDQSQRASDLDRASVNRHYGWLGPWGDRWWQLGLGG